MWSQRDSRVDVAPWWCSTGSLNDFQGVSALVLMVTEEVFEGTEKFPGLFVKVIKCPSGDFLRPWKCWSATSRSSHGAHIKSYQGSLVVPEILKNVLDTTLKGPWAYLGGFLLGFPESMIFQWFWKMITMKTPLRRFLVQWEGSWGGPDGL